ncbi:unnamed protein product [Gadus morhua 'NCC']
MPDSYRPYGLEGIPSPRGAAWRGKVVLILRAQPKPCWHWQQVYRAAGLAEEEDKIRPRPPRLDPISEKESEWGSLDIVEEELMAPVLISRTL